MRKIFKIVRHVIILTLFIVYLMEFKQFIYDMNIENFWLCVIPGLVMLYAI